MKKTNFFKLLMVGATALAIGFTGCQKGPSQDEFEALCARMTTAENSITEISNQLKAMKYVTNIEKKAGTNNTWVFTYHPSGTFELVVDGTPGPTPSGDYLSIGENGNWMIGTTDTGWKASSTTPKIQKDEADGKPYWYFPVIGADNKVTWSKGDKAIATSYVVETAGGWELWIPDANGTMITEPIIIAGADAGIAKIDILGWIVGKGGADENISQYDFDAAEFTVDEDGVITGNVNTGTVGATDPGSLGGGVGTPLVPGATGTGHPGVDLISGDKTFAVNFFYIERFPLDMNYTYVPSNTKNVAQATVAQELANKVTEPAYDQAPFLLNTFGDTWGGTNPKSGNRMGKIPVEKYNVLNTLSAERKGLLVQVFPSTAKLSDMNNITLQNSKGGELPVKWGKPELVSGLLTRATPQESALYFIPGESTTEKYPTTEAKYTGLYLKDALYTLVTPSGLRSEYTPFTFVPNRVKSLEAPVDWVVETDAEASTVTNAKDALFRADADVAPRNRGAYPYGGSKTTLVTANTQIDYVVATDTWYKPAFNALDDRAYLNQAVPVTNAVIDWSLRLIDDTSAYDEYEEDHPGVDINVQYLEGQFGLEFNADYTAFRVNRLPDNLTLACFDLEVRKLGVDGVVYIEYIRIRPVRDGLDTPIPYGDYDIIDKNYLANGALGAPEYFDAPATAREAYLSGSIIWDLTPMFDDLKAIPDGNHTNMAQRWKHSQYGAKDWSIRNMKVTPVTGNPYTVTGPYGGLTNDPTSDLYEVLTNTDTNIAGGDGTNPFNAFGINAGVNQTGTIMVGHNNVVPTKATATAASSTATANVNEFASITWQPQYSVNGVDVLFDVDALYEFTVDFYDEEGDYMNTVVLSFTPKIPETALIEKDPPFWNGGDKTWTDGKKDVLNAFYKDPNTWTEGMAPNGTRYDIALGDYTTVTSDGAGGNGGFKKFGTVAHSAEEWARLNYILTYGKGANATVGSTVADWNAYDKAIAAPAGGAPYVIYPSVAGSTLPTIPTFTLPWYGSLPANADSYPGSVTYPWTTAAVAPYPLANANDMTYTMQNQYVFKAESAGNDYNGDGDTTDTVWVPNDLFQSAKTAAERVAEGNYYGEIMHMDLPTGAAKYLDVYGFDASDAEFNIRVMSALYEGKIVPRTGGIIAPAAAAGEVWPLTKDDVWGETYNTQRYELFKEWNTAAPNARFKYTYIDRVEWIPGANAQNIYSIVDANGAPSKLAIDPTANDASYVAIKPGNPSQTTTCDLIVKVYDRFGKIKEVTLPITITVGPTQ